MRTIEMIADDIENATAIYTDGECATVMLYMSEHVDAKIANIFVCFGFLSQNPNVDIIELVAGNMLNMLCQVSIAEAAYSPT